MLWNEQATDAADANDKRSKYQAVDTGLILTECYMYILILSTLSSCSLQTVYDVFTYLATI